MISEYKLRLFRRDGIARGRHVVGVFEVCATPRQRNAEVTTAGSGVNQFNHEIISKVTMVIINNNGHHYKSSSNRNNDDSTRSVEAVLTLVVLRRISALSVSYYVQPHFHYTSDEVAHTCVSNVWLCYGGKDCPPTKRQDQQ